MDMIIRYQMNRKKKVHTHKNNYDICKSSNIQKKKNSAKLFQNDSLIIE